jgi:hypothetical protein
MAGEEEWYAVDLEEGVGREGSPCFAGHLHEVQDTNLLQGPSCRVGFVP